MYQIRPYTTDFVVEPARIMYHVPNYHLVNNHNVGSDGETDLEIQICVENLCTQAIAFFENGGIGTNGIGNGGIVSDKPTTTNSSTFDAQLPASQSAKEDENA